jgi:hypothetical protein
MKTAQEAIALFKTFVNLPRTKLPWLKGRPNLYDCAAGYTWVSDLKDKYPHIVWVHEVVDVCKKNGTWVQYKKGIEKKQLPQPGDAVIFDWKGTHTRTDHVAMCISASATHLTVVGADQGHTREVSYLNEFNYWAITGWGKPVAFSDTPAAKPVVLPTVAPLIAPKPVVAPVVAPVVPVEAVNPESGI